ncbi:hypothetical protein GN244_ATG10810 [Phytophthora infestans]|uniref:Uncharacterized protein n=1 Tax=Phytophthora infestans TaxID=4787 RepID=A0A833T5D2_PHYIN|nr:hypothetical protein GN244_ATG10810 [Phytophthora infestans]
MASKLLNAATSPGMVAPTTINRSLDFKTFSEPLLNVGNRLKRVREESRDHCDQPPSFDEGVEREQRDSERRAEAALVEQRLQQQRLDEKLRREEEERKEVAARAERDQEQAEERRRHEERMELERAEAR